MSISLRVEPYCDNCPYFEPDHHMFNYISGPVHRIDCKYFNMCRYAVKESKKQEGEE